MSAIIGSLRADLSMRSVAFNKGVDEATRKLNGLRNNFRRIGRQLQGIGQSLTIGLTAPIAAFGALTLKSAGDFQAAMNKVGAVSGATAGELEDLRNAAKEMGATTQFSASQSADALSFLAMAGFSARQSIDALPGTLQLAASAQMDLADAADIVSNVLSGYGMEVSELARVNDVLVKTFTSANTDLRQLGEAMKYAGPIASAAGVSFEEAAAAIGLMGNAGIQSSMAGTSLRGAIGRILEPTASAAAAMRDLGLSFTDSEGKLVSFDQIISQLAPHADDAGLFIELFGQRAGPAMAALVSQGTDSLVNLRSELEKAGGTAERIASAQMEGFNGAMKRLASAFEAVQIAIAESGLLDFATRMADSLAAMLTQLSTVNPGLLRLGTIVAGVAIAIGPLVLAAGLLATGFAAVAPIIVSMTVPLASLATVAGVVVAAWGPLTQAVGFLRDNIILLSPLIGQLAIALTSSLVPALASAVSGFIGLAAATGTRLVAALRFATAGLVTFKGALISTGIGALVVGVGLAIQKFAQLSVAAGRIGNAFAALKAIAKEVFERIAGVATMMRFRIQEVALRIKAALISALADVVSAAPEFINKIIGAFVGAYEAIKIVWAQLPDALGGVVAGAANMVLAGTEKMINFARDALWSFVEWAAGIVSNIPGVEWDVQPLDPVKLGRVESQATGLGADIQGAFDGAMNTDYTGNLTAGLDDVAAATATAADVAGMFAREYGKAASTPLQSVEALSEAQRMLKREVQAAGEEYEVTNELVGELTDTLEDSGEAGSSAGKATSRGASKAAEALGQAADQAADLRDELNGLFKGFVKDLASGDISDAFANLFRSVKEKAGESFADLLSDAFAPNGGGFKAITKGLSNALKTVSQGLSGGLGSIGGLGGLLGAAMPLVGAVTGLVSLVKGFSSKSIVGSGLNLGIENGQVVGNQFDKVKKSSFWGLFSKTSEANSALEAEAQKALEAQLEGIQGAAKGAYEVLGLSVGDSILKSVDLAIQKIDTTDLSEAEIQAKVDAVFASYGNKISQAIGGIDLDKAQILASVQTLLAPLGKAFDLSGLAGSFETTTQKIVKTTVEKATTPMRMVEKTMEQFGTKTLASARNLSSQFGTSSRVMTDRLKTVGTDFKVAADRVVESTEYVTHRSSALLEAAANAAQALADLAGGVEALGKKTAAFYDGFFTDAEKLEVLQKGVDATFERLGISVPATDEAFKALVLSQDLLTESGREAYNALLDIAPQFDAITDAADEAAAAAADAAKEQLEAIQKAEAERLAALKAEREMIAEMRGDRRDLLFDLLPEGQQIKALQGRLSRGFGSLGFDVPKNNWDLRKIIAGFDPRTDTGRTAFEKIEDLVPAFLRVQDALSDAAEAQAEAASKLRELREDAITSVADLLRDPLELDSGRFDNEYEAAISAARERDRQIEQEANNAQLSELRLMRAAIDRLYREQRQSNLEGV